MLRKLSNYEIVEKGRTLVGGRDRGRSRGRERWGNKSKTAIKDKLSLKYLSTGASKRLHTTMACQAEDIYVILSLPRTTDMLHRWVPLINS